MDAAILQAASAAWASISAIAVILLGFVAFAGGRGRAPGSAAFAAFALVWGLQVLIGQWLAYAPAGGAERWHLTLLALLLPLPYFLVQFARSFAREGGRSASWRLVTAGAVALPILVVALLLLAPELIYTGASARGLPRWGPWYPALVVLPFYAALGATLFALDAARRASTTARTALRHGLLAAGLATFTAFSAGNNLSFYASDVLASRSIPLSIPYTLLFGALVAIVLGIGARAAWEASRAPSPKTRRPAAIVAAATLAPLAWGLIEGALAFSLLPRFNTVGLWRLVGVAILAYAFARWRMPELARRSRDTTATAVGVAAAATSGGLAVGLLLLFTPATSVVLLAALALPAATLSPSVRLARRALRVDAEPDHSDATLAPRLETYRAALEASLARDSLGDDAAFLAGLRERLSIGDDVHDALLCIARDTVLPPPDAAHPGYERLRLLGEGAHGRAWLARRRADDELVVLKEPIEQDEASRASLAKQGRIAQQVRHARLVAIQHVASAPRAFLVMDHMPGGSLADRLERAGPVPPANAARLAIDVLEGLEALHDARVTHGDVKPANVLLDAQGRAKLADFGLARAQGAQGSVDATRTMLGPQGTLAAMAPEQLAGAPATASSDVYATGALLYRLLTNESYVRFQGLDDVRARELVATGAPRLPHPRVPPALEGILAQALAKDPAKRPASARAMREALEAALSSL